MTSRLIIIALVFIGLYISGTQAKVCKDRFSRFVCERYQRQDKCYDQRYLSSMIKSCARTCGFCVFPPGMEEEDYGEDVVDDVVEVIQDSGIFPDDKGFMKRVAWVESMFGEHDDTYRDNYNGGIWQVDSFSETQNVDSHPGLKKIFKKIKSEFDIDWMETEHEDLRKPFYSGLAARLYLWLIPKSIPSDVQKQGGYWKKYYNTAAGAGKDDSFTERLKEMP